MKHGIACLRRELETLQTNFDITAGEIERGEKGWLSDPQAQQAWRAEQIGSIGQTLAALGA